MASIGEVSELVRAMYSLFGEKWGKRLGQTIVILILGIALFACISSGKTAVDAIIGWVNSVSRIPIITNLILMIIFTVVFFGWGVAFGASIGYAIRIGISVPMHRKVDVILGQMTDLLNRAASQAEVDKEIINILLSDCQSIQKQWDQSTVTQVYHWLDRRLLRRKVK